MEKSNILKLFDEQNKPEFDLIRKINQLQSDHQLMVANRNVAPGWRINKIGLNIHLDKYQYSDFHIMKENK